MQVRVDTDYSWSGTTYVARDYKTRTYDNGLKVYSSEKRVYELNLYSSVGTIQKHQLSGSTIDLLV